MIDFSGPLPFCKCEGCRANRIAGMVERMAVALRLGSRIHVFQNPRMASGDRDLDFLFEEERDALDIARRLVFPTSG